MTWAESETLEFKALKVFESFGTGFQRMAYACLIERTIPDKPNRRLRKCRNSGGAA
jgi:hypothetical protein